MKHLKCFRLAGILIFATLGFLDSSLVAQEKYALLAGVTKYSDPKIKNLDGPANDVALMQDLLVKKFGFKNEHIRTLLESKKPDYRPTRKNVVREFKQLIEKVKKGDEVFILLAGHGTRAPNLDPNSRDPENDGMDEVFLCSDARGMKTGEDKLIPNAIVDDELSSWISAIRKKGSFVWIILDSCHSGTGVRGIETEVARHVDPLDLVPQSLLDQAAKRKPPSGESNLNEANSFFDISGGAGIVAFYAALPTEQAIEDRLPPMVPNGKYHGLFTFAIGQILQRTDRALTYRELIQLVRSQFNRWGRNFPNPSVEGTDLDRQVLGTKSWPARNPITLSQADDNSWRVNVGAIHGLTPGSRLAIYPPLTKNEKAHSKLLGEVKVLKAYSTLR